MDLVISHSAGQGLLARLALISALLLCPQSSADNSAVEYINRGVLPAGLPFSEAVRVADTYYMSGMIGVKPGSTDLVAGGIEAETHQIMRNLARVLAAVNLELSDIVKCLVMLEDIAEWGQFNKVYADYFQAPYPARSAFGTDGLALGARVELECLASFRPGDVR